MNSVKNSIGWSDYTYNPVTGCTNQDYGICEVKCCYARRLANRLKGRFGYPAINPFTPTFHEDKLEDPLHLRKPSKIFVADMGDLFCFDMLDEWILKVLEVVNKCPQHTFQFLTKMPGRYYRFNFPKNCWLGTTINNKSDIVTKTNWRYSPCNKGHIRFVSFEPLYEDISNISLEEFDWIIIGGATGKVFYPPEEWIKKLEDKANSLNIPIFEKDNLRENWEKAPIRNFPKIKLGKG